MSTRPSIGELLRILRLQESETRLEGASILIALRGLALKRGAKLFRAEDFLNGDINYFLEYKFQFYSAFKFL